MRHRYLVLFTLILCACAQPNRYDPTDAAGPAASPGARAQDSGVSLAREDANSSGNSSPVDLGSNASSCESGVTRCASSGAAVEVCTIDGTWMVKETCASDCQGGVCTGKCTPGSKHCGANGTPELATTAVSGYQRQVRPNICDNKGECAGECKPGSKRCGGANNLTVQICDQNGTWVSGMTCQNLCSSGSCGGDCAPGTKRCGSNNTPETCSPMGTWEPAPQPCPFVCAGAGECGGSCRPGARQCAGLTPQLCDSNGAWKDESAACPYVCRNGACAGVCTPDSRRCASNGTAVETCAGDG